MDQPQYSRPDDSSNLSAVDEGVQGSSIDTADDHSRGKKSLISKVKDKAKDKIHKVKDKLKTKGKKDKDTDTGDEEDVSDDAEVHAKDLPQTPTHGYMGDGSYVNHGKPFDSFGVSPAKDKPYSTTGDEKVQREYDRFVGSTTAETEGNSTSVPVDYSSPLASVDAIMPEPVIKPGSVSELGEQSSSSLGEIPEKPQEEEKVVATEAPDEEHQDLSFGSFGDTSLDKLSLTSEKKDLEAVERDSMSQELGDNSTVTKFSKKPSGGIVEEPVERSEQSDRESPSDEAAVPQGGPEEGANGKAEQSMKKADRDLPATDAGDTSSRGSEKASERPLRDPDTQMPVPERAEFTESMFSSSVADDLRLRDTPSSAGRNAAEESQGPGEPGMSGRDFDYEAGNTNSSSFTANMTQDDKEQELNEPAREQEQFYDPPTDTSSLETQPSGSVDADDYGEQKGKFEQDAILDFDDDEEGEDGKSTGSVSSAATALGSAVGAVGTKLRYFYPGQEQTAADVEARSEGKNAEERKSRGDWNIPPITPQNSSVEGLDSNDASQSWISRAVGILYGQPDKKEGTIEEQDDEGKDDAALQQSEKNGGEANAFKDASDAFVQ